MREILFRGKHTRTGEWVEGLLWKNKYHSDKFFISCFPDKDDNEEAFIVFPETVGQYTGLTDKNGKKIFEGDVIHREYTLIHGERKTTREEQIGVVVFKKGEFRANVVKGKGTWFGIGVVWKGDYIEVIGNIHDNPELLKGGKE